MKQLALIGCGAMGTALLRGILTSGHLTGDEVVVYDTDPDRLTEVCRRYGVTAAGGNLQAVAAAALAILAVKPQVISQVLVEARPALNRDRLLVSIAAGVPLSRLEEAAGVGVPLVRVMPNNPCLVGAGISALVSGSSATPQHLEQVRRVFNCVGRTLVLEESQLDAVTALSGSGPAFVYLFYEALVDAGVLVGLTRSVAEELAAATLLGSARVVAESGRHPAELRDMVTSPAGTTIAGLKALEKGGLRAAVFQAVEAAFKRSQELGRA